MIFSNVDPLDPYKPPFNPINRPWDPSRSIELEEIYILVDLELHGAYLRPIHAQGRLWWYQSRLWWHQSLLWWHRSRPWWHQSRLWCHQSQQNTENINFS